MFQKIANWFLPPIFPNDEGKTRVASVLNALLLSLIFGLVLIGIVTRFERLLNYILSLLLTIGVWLIMRRGLVRLASISIVIGLTILLAIVVPFTGGVRASTYGGYLLVVLLAGLLLGQWTSVAVALFASLLGAILLGIDAFDLWKIPTSTASDLTFWIVFTVYFLVSAVILMLALRLIEDGHRKTQIELTQRIRTQENLQERIEQLATLNEISRTVSTLQNLDNVLETIYRQMKRITSVDAFFISLYNERTNEIEFPLMIDMEVRYNEPVRLLEPNTWSARVLLEDKHLIIHRTAAEIQKPETPTIGNTQRRAASIIMVPLPLGNRVIGVMSVQSYTMNAYSEDIAEILKSIGYQAAIAIENARLYTNVQQELSERKRTEAELSSSTKQLQRQVHELGTLHSVAIVTAESRDEDVMLNRVVDIIHSTLYPDQFGILLWDDEKGRLCRHPSGRGAPPEFLSASFALGEGIVGSVAATGKARRVPDVHLATDYISGRKEIQSELCVPIKYGEHILGVINVESLRLDAFSEADEQLLTTIASQLANAIQNARLLKNLQQELAERIRIENEREKLIKELEDRNAELERFNYTVSHELKSPIVTLKGFVGSISRDLSDKKYERAERDLLRVSIAADKMYETLSDLLELAQTGYIANSSSDVNLVQLIQDVLEGVHERISSHNITVKVSTDLPNVYGDHVRLKEVYENLIVNAIKYMGDQSSPFIEIGSRKDDDVIILYIKDNGMGIDPMYHKRVFGLFDKLDAKSEGTGIGLSLVKRIIEIHGGKIWVESEGAGKGSAFCFTLPSSSQTQ